MATITAVGTASPIAQGQAMMSTATAAARPRTDAPAPATTTQPANVTTRERHHRRHEDALTLSARS